MYNLVIHFIKVITVIYIFSNHRVVSYIWGHIYKNRIYREIYPNINNYDKVLFHTFFT